MDTIFFSPNEERGVAKHIMRVRPKSGWIIVDAPDLRIVPDDLWKRRPTEAPPANTVLVLDALVYRAEIATASALPGWCFPR